MLISLDTSSMLFISDAWLEPLGAQQESRVSEVIYLPVEAIIDPIKYPEVGTR